jgi:hypothetical protein
MRNGCRQPLRMQQLFFSHKNPLFVTIEDIAADVRAQRTAGSGENPLIAVERLVADQIERNFNLARDLRDASIELSFHALYGTPWMRRLGENRQRQPKSHDIAKLPHVQEAIKKSRLGGYAEGIVRMLILLARSRGSVRRDRLERSDKLLHSRPPFSSMTAEHRSRLIYEQSLIVEFAGSEAISTLADLLADPVDRYSALNLVLDVAGPVEDMDAPTIAMFRRFQQALLTMAREWRDPVGEDGLAAPTPDPPPTDGHAAESRQETAA